MNLKLKEKVAESLSAILPITAIVLLICVSLVPLELGTFVAFDSAHCHPDNGSEIQAQIG